ncbi:polysaccharide deacetylase family protein [Jejuia pallidilutea]|jgi:peptidoglycan/xylan/chitin deacetylase (PgdA/CDA1 family)|uniref:Polysaccharide deacetylase n=2 Tax=Jejuia pallidilutea TaxID=504487 RepID=A0A098LNQ7_9FLAO|nr:polysaccharide deacetylase family protein [Jejuia pallidilutea]GAL87997.1 polysaccharide deacetylase [Jejuia pallidilutea]
MPLIPVKTPKVIKSIFPNYVWNIDTTEKVIYLTFDDGPTPQITNWILNILNQYNAKATFFCIGANVEKYPDVFQGILNENHRVGNHTQHHIKGWKTKNKAYIKNVEKAQKVFELNLQNSELRIQNLFRPPYGKITFKQGKTLMALGYKIIMWDVLSFDWDKSITQERCFNNVTSKAKPGSIVVFHDSVKASKHMMYTLPKVLEHFSKKGYSFKALEF